MLSSHRRSSWLNQEWFETLVVLEILAVDVVDVIAVSFGRKDLVGGVEQAEEEDSDYWDQRQQKPQ